MAVEIGVIMLVFLNQAWQRLQSSCRERGEALNRAGLREAVLAGAGRRVRPVMMTSIATVGGLLPIMLSSGTGSEVMSRIAAPMVGGMLSAVCLTLLVVPVLYYLWRARALPE